jgi:V8-like Glu-specific endopeptidase
MRYAPILRLALPALLVATAASGAVAQPTTPGNGGTSGKVTSAPIALKAGATLPDKGRNGATRDILVDAQPQLTALTSVSKSSDGTVTSAPPSAALAAALKGYVPMTPAGGAPTSALPAAAAIEKVADANGYPYRAAGEVEVHYGDNYYYCTAVLIGPKTVATAAGCLWGIEGNPVFADNVVFYPAVNDGNAPFGTYESEDVVMMQGFIDAFSHATSDGPLPYAIGLVHLKEAAGDKLGWFGFQTDLNESYTGHAITYGGGAMLHQMATTTCPVDVASMYRSFAFPNPCAASGNGSPFYVDDAGGGGKILHGMNVESYPDGSTGETRISPVVYQWISDNRQ